jgi:ubiquinone/menaquinone biosynthesis C-methylase UbiE
MLKRVEKIKNLWNKAINDYDLHMKNTGHYLAQEKLMNELKSHFYSPILDLATGTGFLAEKLLENKQILTLNDFSEEIFLSFSQKFAKNIYVDFSNQDAHCIYLDKFYNTIICCNLFYYLEDQNRAINNWKKLLQKDGSIVLFEEYPFHKPNSTEMKDYENELMSLIQPVSPDEIEKLFTKQGLNLINKKKVAIDADHDLFGFVFKC